MGTGKRVHGLLILAKLILSLGLLFWAFSRVHPGQFRARFLDLQPGWLLAAALTFALSNVLGAVQWARLLELSGARLAFRQVLSFYWVGLFFSNLLPANVGGDVVRVVDVARTTGNRRTAVGATLLDRLIGFAAISLLAVLALPLVPAHGSGPLLWMAVLLFSMVTLVFCVSIYKRGLAGGLERWIGGVKTLSLGRRFTALADELHSYRRHTAELLRLGGLAFVVQLLRVAVHVLAAWSMGMRLSPIWFFVIVPILAVVVVLPVSIAGLGIRETAAVGLFAGVGVGPTEAVAQQLLTFFLCLAVNLLGGVIFVTRGLRRPAMARAGDSA